MKCSIPEATRPLLDEIQQLQGHNKAREREWTNLEAVLRGELKASQEELLESLTKLGDMEVSSGAAKAELDAALQIIADTKEEANRLKAQCEGERQEACLREQRWNQAANEASEQEISLQKKLASATGHARGIPTHVSRPDPNSF